MKLSQPLKVNFFLGPFKLTIGRVDCRPIVHVLRFWKSGKPVGLLDLCCSLQLGPQLVGLYERVRMFYTIPLVVGLYHTAVCFDLRPYIDYTTVRLKLFKYWGQ